MTNLVNASIYMNDDVRATWVPVHCSLLPISLWHFGYMATTTCDRVTTLTKGIGRCKMVPVHCCFSVICSQALPNGNITTLIHASIVRKADVT